MLKRSLVGLVVLVTLGLTSTGVWLITAADASPTCTDSWIGPANGGDWTTSGDWLTSGGLNTVPGAGDVACLASATVTVGPGDMATAASVQNGSLDITGSANSQGELSLADASATSNLINLTVGNGKLEGPGAIALTGSFAFDGTESGVNPDVADLGVIGYPTPLAISQTGGGTFQLGESGCPTMYIDGTYTTTSPVTLACNYVLPYGGTLATTSTMTLAPGAYPAQAGSRMTVTAEGYDITGFPSGGTAPQGWNLIQDGGTTTVPTGVNFTPGVGFTLDSGELVLDAPDPAFSLGPGQLSNGLTMNGGTLTGLGTVNGQITQTGGVVIPGQAGAGTLTASYYDQTAGGTLEIDISGTAPADYDSLATSATSLAGTLTLLATPGYAAAAAVGDSFDILTYSSAPGDFTGTFAAVTSEPPLVNGETFNAAYGTVGQVDAVVTAAPVSTPTGTGTTTTQTTGSPVLGNPPTQTGSTTTPTGSTGTQSTPGYSVLGPEVTGAPTISGTPLPGDRLTCNPGTWTEDPSFTYQWELDGTPITGATAQTYTVGILDEGGTLTCTVTGHTAAGSLTATAKGVIVAQSGTLKCPKPTGSFSPTRVGPFSLGETRAAARKSFHDYHVIQSGFDNFCLYGGWGIRGAYRTNRFVFLDTANPFYKLKGISPGDTLKALSAKVKIGPKIVIGLNDWYVATGSSSNYVFKSRRGIVDEIGIANKRDTTGAKAQKRFLSSFKAS